MGARGPAVLRRVSKRREVSSIIVVTPAGRVAGPGRRVSGAGPDRPGPDRPGPDRPGPDRPQLERGQLRRLQLTSWVEAATLLALVGVAVPLKHLAGVSTATAIVGPIHGLAFLACCWTVLETVSGGGWRRAEVVRLVLAALVPFGGLANGLLLRRTAAHLARPADGRVA